MQGKLRSGVSHGEAPFLECSSKGDIRFSAFGARIRGRGNRKIEDIYQGAKVFSDGSTNLNWRAAKGRVAVNQNEVTTLYAQLWDEYISENPSLLTVLQGASGLKDIFGQRGHACQATELWRIRCASLGIDAYPPIAEITAPQGTLDLFAEDHNDTDTGFSRLRSPR